ncbi:MAG: HAMP domain-containing histidine kinase [Deltaproteobacteria bacterium]|nr:MAG: HAMP domain-containing histidine kinase [Deltaproteobacteria bacterium]
MHTAPLTPERLRSIAPTDISRLSEEAYYGDSVTISMNSLGVSDRSIVRELYGFLLDVYRETERNLNADDGGVQALKDLADTDAFDTLVDRVSTLGAALHADHISLDVKRSLHDVRGGSLMALIMHLDMALEDDAIPEDVQRVFILARDHLKMMRNAIQDLDRARYEADLEERAHSIDLLREKWTNVTYAGGRGTAKVRFHCDFHGAVSQRCMEFSALDRVIYNLVNNASQHAADGQVDIAIVPVDDAASTHLRFAVMNKITDAQRQALAEAFGDDLSQLYKGGFTTGGHGIGLRVCGDFVTHGYARESLDQALADQLLGVNVVDDTFVAWFHWPGERHADAGARAAK